MLLFALSHLSLPRRTPIAELTKTIPFTRRTLARLLADETTSTPGARIDSPPFEAGGSSWQVQLYLLGAGECYADRVGVYIKRLAGGGKEVDATFAMSLQVLPSPAALEVAPAARAPGCVRGSTFRCGMTFCEAKEAGESVGRCDDWGAHLYSSSDLLRELEQNEQRVLAVDVE